MSRSEKSLQQGSAAMLVLALLKKEEMYGYQMIEALAQRSGEVFRMKEGTLYPILHALEGNGAVKSYEQEAPSGRVRRYYHITEKGKRLLETKKEEWHTFSEKVNAILADCSPA